MSDVTQVPPEDLVAKSGFFSGMNAFMGVASMVMILAFVLFTIQDVEFSAGVFTEAKDFIIGALDWFYVLVVTLALFFVFWLLISRFGDVKLGKDDDEPDFSTFSWICMLFSAGLGSGLIYWGVAEPMYHIQDSPFLSREGIEPGSVEAASSAIRITIFHWGLHGWALYVLVGLSLCYFAYRKGLPLSLRSALYPVLKEKIYGPWGHLVDLVGVFGTIFGLATSLGLGVAPIAAGLERLGWMSNTTTNQLILVAAITVMGTASAASGVGKGVRILSELNVWASLGLLLLFLILGPTAFILGMVITGAGEYLWNVIPMGFWIDGEPDRQWQSWWTIFYWGWWIAWCPFVGMFIARISKGRTIRQFCFCVLLVPTSVVVLWMGVFGGAAVGVDLFNNAGVVDAVNADYATGVFQTIAGFGYECVGHPDHHPDHAAADLVVRNVVGFRHAGHVHHAVHGRRAPADQVPGLLGRDLGRRRRRPHAGRRSQRPANGVDRRRPAHRHRPAADGLRHGPDPARRLPGLRRGGQDGASVFEPLTRSDFTFVSEIREAPWAGLSGPGRLNLRSSGVRSVGQLIVGRQGLGAIDEGRAAAHIGCDADGLDDLVAAGAVPDRGFGVKADAAIATASDPDRQGDEFLGLGIEGRRPGGRLRQSGERGRDVRRHLPIGRQGLGEFLVGFWPIADHRVRSRHVLPKFARTAGARP